MDKENEIAKQAFENVLQNKCSYEIRKFYRKTPMLESLFNKVHAVFIKKRLQHRCFLVKFFKFLRMSFLTEQVLKIFFFHCKIQVSCQNCLFPVTKLPSIFVNVNI